jgi:CRISPR-associated protein Csb2
MATHPADRERSEWPPHPDRLFMALAAGYFETDQDPAERKALDWLAEQPAPSIFASKASFRTVVSHFVPVNVINKGSKSPLKGIDALPDNRSRQERCFPVAVPVSDTVYFQWDSEPGSHREALESLCQKLIRIGHSASLCQAAIVEAPEQLESQEQLVPVANSATMKLRVTDPERLRELEECYKRGSPPTTSRAMGYAKKIESRAPIASAPHVNLLILEAEPNSIRLSLEATLQVTQALRGTIFAALDPGPYPEWLSGHQSDGQLSLKEHMACVPLAYVGSEYANGLLKGIGLALPREAEAQILDRFLLEDGEPREITLKLGALGCWWLRLQPDIAQSSALKAWTWQKPSATWASVTPIVLDRHPHRRLPKDLGQRAEAVTAYYQEVEQIIRESCRKVGLPEILEIAVTKESQWTGAPTARSFPPLTRKSGGTRQHFHVWLRFAEPVRGPIIIGAGRFRGYGLCRPIHEGHDTDEI